VGFNRLIWLFQHLKPINTATADWLKYQKTKVLSARLLKHYLHVRPSFEGPLFCHYGGKLLTRYQFAAVLNKALNFIRIDSSRIKTHSFRIGAATMHFANGVSQEDIQKMGRWKSDAYKRYIR
jgi:site-specific recombinase XerD